MPLPLPNLDTRRWADLVDEGRALVPRYAPAWTDHNIHDPGITLLELFAWEVEQAMYRANRIPERHRRKFLDLVGYRPAGPGAASAAVRVVPKPGQRVDLPSGTELNATRVDGSIVRFRTLDALTGLSDTIAAAQSFDGTAFVDASRAVRAGNEVALFGSDPVMGSDRDATPAFYIGFAATLPVGVSVNLLFVSSEQPSVAAAQREHDALRNEADEQRVLCQPPRFDCVPPRRRDRHCAELEAEEAGTAAPQIAAAASGVVPHHDVRVAWEYYTAPGVWRALDPSKGEIQDDTRSLTLTGLIRVTLPSAMVAVQLGAIGTALCYLRCRVVHGRFDVPPAALVIMNGVRVTQAVAATSTLSFASGPLAAAAPALVEVGVGDGEPEQSFQLSDAPILRESLRLWSIEGEEWHEWHERVDFDSSSGADHHVLVDADAGKLRFGNGDRGRVPPDGARLIAQYDATDAASGDDAQRDGWTLANSAWNAALFGGALGATANAIASVSAVALPSGGAAGEDVATAAGRALDRLWAHERLVVVAPASPPSLDDVPRARVLALSAPERAATLRDFERITLGVPGTRVRRARAWPELDVDFPGVRATGSVTVVVIPSLPAARPQPSRGLLRALRQYLERRRTIGTRLRVVGPRYVEVTVTTSVRAAAGAEIDRVRDDVLSALMTFLHPTTGGPDGNGWPFGRDVFRSELLRLIAVVPGVDFVATMTMAADGVESTCDNVCVSRTSLVASGHHRVEVAR